jgi:hypothetical protein
VSRFSCGKSVSAKDLTTGDIDDALDCNGDIVTQVTAFRMTGHM